MYSIPISRTPRVRTTREQTTQHRSVSTANKVTGSRDSWGYWSRCLCSSFLHTHVCSECGNILLWNPSLKSLIIGFKASVMGKVNMSVKIYVRRNHLHQTIMETHLKTFHTICPVSRTKPCARTSHPLGQLLSRKQKVTRALPARTGRSGNPWVLGT